MGRDVLFMFLAGITIGLFLSFIILMPAKYEKISKRRAALLIASMCLILCCWASILNSYYRYHDAEQVEFDENMASGTGSDNPVDTLLRRIYYMDDDTSLSKQEVLKEIFKIQGKYSRNFTESENQIKRKEGR